MAWKKRPNQSDESDPSAPETVPLVLIVVQGRPGARAPEAAFRALGYRTRVETAGQDAVFAVDEETPDVVYLDCWRDEMDPLTFLNVTQKMHPHLGSSVIALVPANDGGVRRAQLEGAGVRAILEPPITAGSVAGAVGRVLLKALSIAAIDEVEDVSILSNPSGGSARTTVEPEGPLSAGEVIDGRYVVRGVLGKGGAAIVYRVFDRELKLDLALKLLKANAMDPHAERRFQREVRICAALRNPNVVRTFAGGRAGGRPYFTMEALEGRTLRQFMREVPADEMPVRFGIDLLLHICRGLAATHRLGVIHRDIKPSNLFVVGDGPGVKLTDFGIARDDQPSSAMTTLGIVVGTPGYVAPERLVMGGPHEPASDIFSLGIVGYELFARRRPFTGRNPVDLLRAMTEEPPTPLTRINPRVPYSLDQLLRSMIASEPSLRPASVLEVAGELRSIAAVRR